MKIRNVAILVGVILIFFTLAAWSPWVSKTYAENKVMSAFNEAQKGIQDGCGFNCVGCGITGSGKVFFGYFVDIEYGCGMRPLDAKNLNEKTTIFVSFIGTVHNFKK